MSLLGSARSKTKRNCRSRLASARPGCGLHRKSPPGRVALAGARRPRPLPGTGLWRRPLATNARLVDCPQNRWPHAKSRAANTAAPRPLSNVLARPHPRPCRSERNRRAGPPTGLWPAIRFHQRRLARLGPRAPRNEKTARRTQNRPAGTWLFPSRLALRTLAKALGRRKTSATARVEQHTAEALRPRQRAPRRRRQTARTMAQRGDRIRFRPARLV